MDNLRSKGLSLVVCGLGLGPFARRFAHSHESAAQKVAALSERLAVSETKMTTAASTVTSMRSEVRAPGEGVRQVARMQPC